MLTQKSTFAQTDADCDLPRPICLQYKLEGLKEDGDWSDVHRLMREVQDVKRLGEEKAKAKTKRPSATQKTPAAATKKRAKGKSKPLADDESSELSEMDEDD